MSRTSGCLLTFQSAKEGDECEEHDWLYVEHEIHRVFQAELASLHHRLRERPSNAACYRGREDHEEPEEVKLCRKKK